MTRTYRVGPGVLVATLCLSVCLSTSLLAQRADRAVISGVVTDPQGAALPGATVTIHNQATGVDTILVTNAAGAYTSPPLVLGQYSVTVDMQANRTTRTNRRMVLPPMILERPDGSRISGERKRAKRSAPVRGTRMSGGCHFRHRALPLSHPVANLIGGISETQDVSSSRAGSSKNCIMTAR